MRVIALLLAVGGVAGVIAANIIYYRMIDQVNALSPPGKQISRFYHTPWGMFDLLGRHKQLYPGSRLSHALWLCYICGALGFVVGVPWLL